MQSSEFLNIALGVGVLLIAVFFGIIALQIVATLKTMQEVLYDVRDTTKDISMVREGIKSGVLSVLSQGIRLLRRR